MGRRWVITIGTAWHGIMKITHRYQTGITVVPAPSPKGDNGRPRAEVPPRSHLARSRQFMNTEVRFRSTAFNCTEPRDYFINPCCFGDDVCRWLIRELRARGHRTADEPGQED